MKSSEEYWKERLLEESRRKQVDEVSLDRRIRALYDYYFREIEREISSFFSSFAVRENMSVSEVRKRVSDMDVEAFSKKVGRYIREKNLSGKARSDLAVYNLKMKISRLELLQYQMDLNMVSLFDEEYRLSEKFLRDGIDSELRSQAGILGMVLENPKDIRLDAQVILNTPFKGASWSSRIWQRQGDLRLFVARAVEGVVFRGDNVVGLLSSLRRAFDVSRYEARRLLVTEQARMQSEVQRESIRQSGFSSYVIVPEYRACDVCKSVARSREYFSLDAFVVGSTAPPFHPHCRCAVSAKFVDDGLGVDGVLMKSK